MDAKWSSDLHRWLGFLWVELLGRNEDMYCIKTVFVTRVTRRVPLVEQELVTLPEHLS
jgi:hypothetical protein